MRHAFVYKVICAGCKIEPRALLFLPLRQAEYNQTDHVRVCQSKPTLQLRTP